MKFVTQSQRIHSTLDFLFSLQKFGIKIGLRNIRRLLRSFGNPHSSLKTIHIAGTNGKGSTSSMIAAILTAAGYKVGLYTSPHLVKFNERIRINGKMISDEKIIRYTNLLKSEIQNSNATFFEATTAIAFKYFADANVDFAVIETGLGGRLDSTNVIRPLVSIITSIGKDHTDLLGKTITSIATEKAGIIKPSVPVVVGEIKGIALRTIIRVAKEKKSPLLFSAKMALPTNSKIQETSEKSHINVIPRSVVTRNLVLSLKNKSEILRFAQNDNRQSIFQVSLQLKGNHQILNAKTAVAAITIVSQKFVIGDKAIIEGLQNTMQLTGLRGRFELIQSKSAILLDVAHNPDGMKVLTSEIKKLGYKKIVIIFATMKDKDYRLSLCHLKQLNPLIIATQPAVERALSADHLFSVCQMMKLHCFLASNVKEAILIGKKLNGTDGLLVITGSHFLVGEAIPLLKSNKKNA